MKLSTFLIGGAVLQWFAHTLNGIFPYFKPVTDVPLIILVCTVCIVLTLEKNRKAVNE